MHRCGRQLAIQIAEALRAAIGTRNEKILVPLLSTLK
jgi:hypothetical protein